MKVCPRFPALLAALMLAGQATGQAEVNATVSGTIKYVGPVTGPIVLWAFENGQKVTALTLPNGPGPYSMQLPMNRDYDIKAFRDGDADQELDAGWQVGEPYAHHGDWNSTSSSFNTFLLDGNKTGIDVNIAWHNDSDGDGFYDWDEYVAGSEGNDSSSTPGIGYGLVAHWTFDETNGSVLGGSSANEINGTLVGFGSNSSAHWVPGKTGGSLRFDGVDDYISFPGATPLDDVHPFSFAGWIKLDQNGSGYVLAKRSLESGYWRFFASSPTKNWLIRQTTGTAPSLATSEVTPFFQWQHVALTWNGLLGAQNSSIYLDGTLVSNITQTSGSGELTSDVGNLFTLGNRPQNNSSFFKGWMDDFRIWNRVLLPHEVNTLHQGPSFPLTDANFTQAIDLWFSDQASATATYGHIRDWNVGQVTDMSEAFKHRTTFDQNISGWDVSNIITMHKIFDGAHAFNHPIGDWNVSQVTDMDGAFAGASAFDQDIGDWDVSYVTTMVAMFQSAFAFDQDIGDWNVSRVTDFNHMFFHATSFNQPIGRWDVGSATIMGAMFKSAFKFNQELKDWNVSKATNLHYMFYAASDFNQPIGDWNVSASTDLESMFWGAGTFDQDISDWNVSSVTNMNNIFDNANSLSQTNKGELHKSFSSNSNWPYDWAQYVVINDSNFQAAVNLWFSNQADANATYGHIRDWNVSQVTDMSNAFQNRTTFDENITGWDVSNVNDMSWVFSNASGFNQPIGSWNTSNVIRMDQLFYGANSFNQPIGDWNVSKVSQMQDMFRNATDFNQSISGWDVSNVTAMHNMFQGAVDFDQNISRWNVGKVILMSSMFEHAISFNQDLSDWNTSADVNMSEMFLGANALSNANKGLMHSSFKNNNHWPYDWSAYADTNATLSGTVNYSGAVSGPVVVWAFGNGQKVAELTLPNGPGPYSLQLPKDRNYDVKAFRDGNGNGTLDAGWQVGEPYAHHGDWNSTTSSFNTLLLDGNKTGIDLNISWHNDSDGDGFLDWDEYIAGSEGNDSNSTPGLNFGLVAWYPFDGNASDMSGNGNHGTVHGAILGTDRHGRVGQAYSFDGVDDYIRIASSEELRDLTEYTISVWAWSQNFSANYNPLVLKSSGDVSSFEIYGGNGFTLIHNRSSTYKYQYYSALPSSRWNHLLISYSNGTLSKYDDGSLHASSTGWANPEHHDFPLNIGKSTWQNEGGKALFYHNGSIDEVRIYDRALSASEVEKLYHLERPGSPLTDANFTTAVNLWFSDEANATKTYGHISNWDVSGVTNMSNAFKNRTTFNEDISGWGVSNVTNMNRMFEGASSFNQPIGHWDVSAVTTIWGIFTNSIVFNQPIGTWEVGKVTNFASMFKGASIFDRPLSDWNTSSSTNMASMFKDAISFNQEIGNWDVSSVTTMHSMFDGADLFNKPIGDWNVSSVTTIWGIFRNTNSFNQDLGTWNTSNITNMSVMFEGANSFNGLIANWDVSSVTNFINMFQNTHTLSNANKGLIHNSFKNNSHWPYDWSAHNTHLPTDNNQTATTPDNNGTNPPVDQNRNITPPPVENNQTQNEQNATTPITGEPAPTLFRPLPKTLAREELKDGKFRFWGQILADGGSPVKTVAFELADNMLFRNSSLQPASLFLGSPNFYLELKLEPGKRYYYRAVATNAVGTTYGSPKRLTTLGDSMHWWSNTVLTQGGWRTSPWFGTFRRHEGTEWIYHAKLGWVYPHPDGSGGLWVWFRDHHWTWTQSGAFPYLWNHDRGGWLYLLGTRNGRPVFYHYETDSLR